MVSPCKLHHDFDRFCDACVLWRVELHNIIRDSLDKIEQVIGSESLI